MPELTTGAPESAEQAAQAPSRGRDRNGEDGGMSTGNDDHFLARAEEFQRRAHAAEARLKEAERLIADTRPCVESWKHKHERAYKAAQRHERPCHAQWHADNVITATALLARIDAWCAGSADEVQK